MSELLVDFITSLDGYASGEGWPGCWGFEGPEYLAWLGEQPEVTYLMGAKTYRLMSGFAAGEMPDGPDEFRADEEASVDGLTRGVEGGVLLLARGAAHVGQLHARPRRRGRRRPGDEARGSGLLSTIGSLEPVPVAAASRSRRSLPGRDVPGDHRRHGRRTHLRRLPRRRA